MVSVQAAKPRTAVGVGLAGVRVPDVGGEELEDALGGGRVGREEGAGAGYRRAGEFPVLGLRSWESVSGRLGMRTCWNMNDNILYHT